MKKLQLHRPHLPLHIPKNRPVLIPRNRHHIANRRHSSLLPRRLGLIRLPLPNPQQPAPVPRHGQEIHTRDLAHARRVGHALDHQHLVAEPADLVARVARRRHQPLHVRFGLLAVFGVGFVPDARVRERLLEGGREGGARVPFGGFFADGEADGVGEFHPFDPVGVVGEVVHPAEEVRGQFVFGFVAEVRVVVGFGGAHGVVDDGADGGEVVEVGEGHGVLADGGLGGEVVGVDAGFAGFDGGELGGGVAGCKGGFFGGGVGEVVSWFGGRGLGEAHFGGFEAFVLGGWAGVVGGCGVELSAKAWS